MASKSSLLLVFLFLLAALPVSSQALEEEQTVETAEEAVNSSQLGKVAHLQVLNKITARTSILKIKAGDAEKFGNIDIIIKDCWRAPPEEKPEVATLLEVFEEKKGEDRHLVFNGWMFASSPAISALEHPVYDIVVLDCVDWKGE